MARVGLQELIADVRLMCELGTADYTVAGRTYWTDSQLESELDKCRKTISREPLLPQSEYTNGTVVYRDYYWGRGNVETYDTNNAEIFHLEDSGGTVVGTADYTANYEAQHIRFAANTSGSVYYLSYRSYDLNRVASSIWKKKAAHVANRFDLSSDNHNLRASQLIKHYLGMAKTYAQQAGPQAVTMVRGDLA